MAMIKRWRNELLTYLYVKYVFMPMLTEAINEEPTTHRGRNMLCDAVDMAMVEKDYNTLQ